MEQEFHFYVQIMKTKYAKEQLQQATSVLMRLRFQEAQFITLILSLKLLTAFLIKIVHIMETILAAMDIHSK